MSKELERSIDVWAAEVENISHYDDELEVSAALVRRDGIQDALNAGETLTPEYRAKLRDADEAFWAQREALVAKFPGVFTPARQEAGPPSYWWWFLNEGPDVRKRREAA